MIKIMKKKPLDLKKLSKHEYMGAVAYVYFLSFLKGLTYSMALTILIQYVYSFYIPFYFIFFFGWVVPDLLSAVGVSLIDLRLHKFSDITIDSLNEKEKKFYDENSGSDSE
jgi:hypothetical protein